MQESKRSGGVKEDEYVQGKIMGREDIIGREER